MLLSVCIVTYKRPELLRKLLYSLSKQFLPESVELEIIVVENDEMQFAKEVVEDIKKNTSLKLKYFLQPVKNISLTRNVTVAKAKGEYILFIDDDEFASDHWISNLYYSLTKFNADAAFGRVISYYEPGTADWIKNCFLYNRPAPITGTIAFSTRTGNCMIKTSLIRSVEGPFDPTYGLSGGEDTQLFGRLRKKGAKFINCQEAVTYEYVHPDRTKFKWLFRRAFRTGNNVARRKLEFASGNKLALRSRIFVVGSAFTLISILLTILFFMHNTSRLNWSLKIAANSGKVAAVMGCYASEYV